VRGRPLLENREKWRTPSYPVYLKKQILPEMWPTRRLVNIPTQAKTGLEWATRLAI